MVGRFFRLPPLLSDILDRSADMVVVATRQSRPSGHGTRRKRSRQCRRNYRAARYRHTGTDEASVIRRVRVAEQQTTRLTVVVESFKSDMETDKVTNLQADGIGRRLRSPDGHTPWKAGTCTYLAVDVPSVKPRPMPAPWKAIGSCTTVQVLASVIGP